MLDASDESIKIRTENTLSDLTTRRLLLTFLSSAQGIFKDKNLNDMSSRYSREGTIGDVEEKGENYWINALE